MDHLFPDSDDLDPGDLDELLQAMQQHFTQHGTGREEAVERSWQALDPVAAALVEALDQPGEEQLHEVAAQLQSWSRHVAEVLYHVMLERGDEAAVQASGRFATRGVALQLVLAQCLARPHQPELVVQLSSEWMAVRALCEHLLELAAD